MSAPIPETEPRELFQARTVKWSRNLTDYPTADGWQLSYDIIYGATTVALVWNTEVVASGGDFQITIPATKITGLTIGQNARLHGKVTLGAEVFDVYDAALKIKVVGELSFARQALTAVEAMLLGNASREEQNLQIVAGGISKSLGFCTKKELAWLRNYYSDMVAAEDALTGAGSGRRILSRYVTPS